MGLAERILERLEGIAETSSAKGFKEYEAVSLIFHSSRYEDVIRGLNDVLGGIAKDGEVISSAFGEGEVVDSGVKHLEVVRGMLYEVYDYKAMSSSFIRLYHLKGEKEWLALYVDENPHTPWWEEEERKR
ncbi:MAG: hypothetical protein ACE5G7_02105 [Candidatus Hydrothermarchaeaceae archaeon]